MTIRVGALLILISIPAFPQIHVTASPLSAPTLKAMFGKSLPREYSAVQVDICSSEPHSIAVPLGMIRQSFSRQFPQSGVSVLGNAVASQVIVSTQGNSKKAVAGRIVFAAAGAAAVAAGFSGLTVAWKTGLTSFAVDGPQLWQLFSSVATPAALIRYSDQALPEMIHLSPGGCLPKPSVQLVEGKVQAVDFEVTLKPQGETK